MKNVIRSAPCGLIDLCIIACPNNRVLGEGMVIKCPSDVELADDNVPLKVEFAEKTELPRQVNPTRE